MPSCRSNGPDTHVSWSRIGLDILLKARPRSRSNSACVSIKMRVVLILTSGLEGFQTFAKNVKRGTAPASSGLLSSWVFTAEKLKKNSPPSANCGVSNMSVSPISSSASRIKIKGTFKIEFCRRVVKKTTIMTVKMPMRKERLCLRKSARTYLNTMTIVSHPKRMAVESELADEVIEISSLPFPLATATFTISLSLRTGAVVTCIVDGGVSDQAVDGLPTLCSLLPLELRTLLLLIQGAPERACISAEILK
mmetsp:Transcript_35163/g.91223  ORF Transcript_35163/g.91223 Transcript_35163/m.91223 type:complete len:251 (+) Transcript_35163:2534-3286(+)